VQGFIENQRLLDKHSWNFYHKSNRKRCF